MNNVAVVSGGGVAIFTETALKINLHFFLES